MSLRRKRQIAERGNSYTISGRQEIFLKSLQSEKIKNFDELMLKLMNPTEPIF